ncbi:MFS transporter [Phenylobacterium sp.]|uniref:MFS transporter n=1 Tax=Phenylobacterium sp. TaxID=1871053 RepID=UPI00260101CF|nr:MFS transporter [Phenylobacterium sp.]MBX3485455.1 MFS transporter [Phenylobacterium sp.]MCW5758821.1 MFS transporter [Phenylobacterium sp.]
MGEEWSSVSVPGLARPPLDRATKVLYGVGAAASAIKQRGLSAFLMLFYNQVVGLDPEQVALGIFIALIFDAVIDPTVGLLSDNTRSRWGRRHPWMYAAAAPVAIGYFLLWTPPSGWESAPLFGYMLACLLTVRLFDTFFELPALALGPELESDYHGRATLYAYRQFFAVLGGLGMTILVYQVLMPDEGGRSGLLLGREGWTNYAVIAALLIFATILISTAATHGQIRYLHMPSRRRVSVRTLVGETVATLSNRHFLIITIFGLFVTISVGVKYSMEIYFNLYFWELTSRQLALIATVGTVCGLGGVLYAPHLVRALGKRNAMVLAFIVLTTTVVTPISLRLLGVLPLNGDPVLFYILLVDLGLHGATSPIITILTVSMAADVVEDSQVKTGRRSEGVLLSADDLLKKLVSGVGLLISGVILAAAAFPKGAQPGQVPAATLEKMATLYVPIMLALYGAAIATMLFFRLGKEQHDINLATLLRQTEAEEAEEALR